MALEGAEESMPKADLKNAEEEPAVVGGSSDWQFWDDLLSQGAMFLVLFFQFFAICTDIWGICTGWNGSMAFSVMKVSNDICGFMIACLLVTFWYMLCFTPFMHTYEAKDLDPPAYKPHGLFFNTWIKPDKVQKVMKSKTRVSENGCMPGGFIPRLGAFSVGVLLFVSSVFVEEKVVRGSALASKTGWVLPLGQRCRAQNKIDQDYDWKFLNDRLNRRLPSSSDAWSWSEHNATNKNNCFLGTDYNKIPVSFSYNDILKKDANGAIMPDKVVDNLARPPGQQTMLCFYQCALWKRWNFEAFITNAGKIVAGAGVVVVMTEFFSSRIGWEKVTEATTPLNLEWTHSCVHRFSDVWHCTGVWPGAIGKKRRGRSRFGAACVLIMLYVWLKFYLIAKIDTDGFWTVDYYTNFAALLCLFCSVLLRWISLYEGSPCVFTENLWKNGKDDFLILTDLDKFYGEETETEEKQFLKHAIGDFPVVDELSGNTELKYVSIDLYQWIHMPRRIRTDYLILYARRPSPDKAFKTLVFPLVQHTDKHQKSRLMKMKQDVLVDSSSNEEEKTGANDMIWTGQELTVEPGITGLMIGCSDNMAQVAFRKEFDTKGQRMHLRLENGTMDVSCMPKLIQEKCQNLPQNLDDPQYLDAVKEYFGDKNQDKFEICTIHTLNLVEVSPKWDNLAVQMKKNGGFYKHINPAGPKNSKPLPSAASSSGSGRNTLMDPLLP